MPASEETREKWRKRKRDQRARKYKLRDSENGDTFYEKDDDNPNLDSPHDQETKYESPHHIAYRINQISQESEKLVDGGLRICEFPTVVKRLVKRPHSSVFCIVEAERAARNGDHKGQGYGRVAMLENISYGQLQALSTIPPDSPALLASSEETAAGSYVIRLPRTAGRGVTKRFGSAACVHVLPVHSDWFSLNSVHRLEKQVVPHFFSGKSEHTPEKYMECRNFIVAKYMKNPEKYLSVADCQGLITGIDIEDLTRITRFLDHWGVINYCATSLKPVGPKDGTYLCEDSNSELCVPSAALKSIDGLIQFDKPKCRLKATDVYPELVVQCDEDADFDCIIREHLSEHECNYCSRPVAMVYYQSQKEVDILLCLDCFHEGRFVTGHSSLDFVKVDSSQDYGDIDGDSWNDQETLLLLEGMQLHNKNWNKIADHVGSKSKAQCILHFVRLPLDGSQLENIDVPGSPGSSTLQNHYDQGRTAPNSNGFNLHCGDSEIKIPFSNSENPVMNLVAFIASSFGPRVAAACAHASLASLSKDGEKEASPSGVITNLSKTEAVPLSAERVRGAAKDGLTAAAIKAKLFADHDEREIQRLSANTINHQLKKLELKLKQFTEIETLLMRECEQMERTRQKIASERALMMSSSSSQLVSPSAARPMSSHDTSENNRQQHVLGSQQQQPFVSGFSNNNHHQVHSHMPQQQVMGPKLPLSSMHTPSISNAMFGATSYFQSSLGGYPMLRPSVSGNNSGLGKGNVGFH